MPRNDGAAERIRAMLLDQDDELDDTGVDGEVRDEVASNALRQVAAMALQKAGDLVVDPKTVLSWLLAHLSASSAALAMLVPVRESGSLLPQAGLAGFVRRRAVRKWLWVAGASGQASFVCLIAVAALTMTGPGAGWMIVAALAGFALARSLSSIASKDVMGRTIPRGGRGRVTGAATVASGAVAITVGVILRVRADAATPASVFAVLLFAAAAAWVVAAIVYAGIREPAGDVAGTRSDLGSPLALLRDDGTFRRFVVARGLLLVSALSPPFVVALATQVGSGGLAGLGPFVIGSGVAALVGGRFWGRWADRSSRMTMALAATAASAVVVALLLLLLIEQARSHWLLYPSAYLLLAIIHTGTRIGRKTYIIDLADGDDRTQRVAASNAAMGVILLATGALSAFAARWGSEVALGFLAALGFVGAFVSRTLPEAHPRR